MNFVTRSLSDVLSDFKTHLKATYSDPNARVCVADILAAFHERGFGFFLFLIALPAALPLPALGVNMVIALPLLLLTGQQALGFHKIWLPQKIMTKTVSLERLENFIDAALPWVVRMEYFIRPRWCFITQGYHSRVIGVCGFIMALAVSIPLPLTNTVPSFGIALMAVGVLMRDGCAVIAGMVIGVMWISVLVLLGEVGLRLLIGSIL